MLVNGLRTYCAAFYKATKFPSPLTSAEKYGILKSSENQATLPIRLHIAFRGIKMNRYFAWFGLSGTLVLTLLLSLTALVLALCYRTKDRLLCAIGMLLSSGGDIVLAGLFGIAERFPGIYFYLGTGFFILGHLLYIAAYRAKTRAAGCRIYNRGFWCGVIFTAFVFAFLTVYMLSAKVFPGIQMYGLCLVYTIIIGANLSVIWSYAYTRRGIHMLAALGVLIFFVSDLIIGAGRLCGIEQFDFLIWWLYPIGQFLMIVFA